MGALELTLGASIFVGLIWVELDLASVLVGLVIGLICPVLLGSKLISPKAYEGGYRELNHLLLNVKCTSRWINLGFWIKDDAYSEACERLVKTVGDKVKLCDRDRILDVGFGHGEQVLIWLNQYNVSDVKGVNISAAEVSSAKTRIQREEMDFSNKCDLRVASAVELPFATPEFDVVLSIDSAYHYDTRASFFQQAFTALKAGGRLGMADIVLTKPLTSLTGRLALRALCSASGIPISNMIDITEYQNLLHGIGYTEIEAEDITDNVFQGFANFIEKQVHEFSGIGGSSQWAYYKWCGAAARWNAHRKVLSFYLVTAKKP